MWEVALGVCTLILIFYFLKKLLNCFIAGFYFGVEEGNWSRDVSWLILLDKDTCLILGEKIGLHFGRRIVYFTCHFRR